MLHDSKHEDLTVLGTSTTNANAGSQHRQPVEARHLWSYAQEEALVAMSERGPDGIYRLLTDPERRAKRIAARYADLYFKSAEKSQGSLQFYWPALAAFVVKDIVEAYRYSREEVLNGGWRNAMRTSALSSVVASAMTDGSPYEHAMRVYAALAKGNLWLFMDIYPWLWFFLEYGLSPAGQLNAQRLTSHVGQRDSATLQQQSRQALQELPFAANWLGRLKTRMSADPVYAQASEYFDTPPMWAGVGGGYGQQQANANQAHRYVKQHVKDFDDGYRTPPSQYWHAFAQAYYVMDEERREMRRVAMDGGATARLQEVARFSVKPEMRDSYGVLISEYGASASDKAGKQKQELVFIARHEQINVLQPLIYSDPALIKTMDANHAFSRWSDGFLSPKYAVVYSASPKTDDPTLQSVFDPPTGVWSYLSGASKSLPDPVDRMEYVSRISEDFDGLMNKKRDYMDAELHKIRGWLNA